MAGLFIVGQVPELWAIDAPHLKAKSRTGGVVATGGVTMS